jgi:hypothetical protein
MNYKSKQKVRTIIFSIITLAFLTGCSQSTSIVKEGGITIERINSAAATITRTDLQTSETALILRGELESRFLNRRAIPGYLHIELIHTDGKVFKEAQIRYKKKSAASRVSTFFVEIANTSSDIKSIRIAHYDSSSYKGNSQWQDVNQKP